jgi:hypothetical protein
MKTKILLVAALFGAAVMSANAGVRFGISIGLPQTVVVSTAPACAPPVASAPVVVVQTLPACPGVGYVWAPGYYTAAHVWVGGSWTYRPTHVVYNHYYRGGYRHDGYRR